MSVTHRYKAAWEGFWQEAPEGRGTVFWDSEPALTSGVHLALLEPELADRGLPLVDLGCGNGTQTRYLADRLPRVLGVDLSAAAVRQARGGDELGEVRFEQLDAADGAAVARLHAELGDANVYVRGVLHQAEEADRQALADAVAVLVGERGRAILVELAEAAGPLLLELAKDPGGPPPKLRPVFEHGIAPGRVADAALLGHIAAAGLDVLASGELPLTTTEYTADGSRLELPSKWLVVGHAVGHNE
ncbi:class I SAM-dependent methyltransferase [Streptomyces sp. NPDC050504]|uniref:class I SAM-dependent methyltransferase n=1 Tax=Streptomyces sp. NPDC050504 TaxID=3365618 RepID=UPI0037A8EC3B